LSSESAYADAAPLAGKVAIVTGAATGIGKGIAARLAFDGAAVLVNHLEAQTADAEAVAAGIREAGGSAATAEADISRCDRFAAMVERANEAFGKINILVNNAAVAPLTPIEDATDSRSKLSSRSTSRARCTAASWPRSASSTTAASSTSRARRPGWRSPATASTTCRRARSSS
jgi:3-oxoacyl-[acyl-carrier protein] reductase